MKRDSKSKAGELLEKTVDELISRSGGYIASFDEVHYDHKLERFTFDAYVKGNTHLKNTFFLSKIFANLVAPMYNVTCFLIVTDNNFGKNKLLRRVMTVHRFMKETNVKFGWLFIFSTGISNSLRKTIQILQTGNIGITCLDVVSGELVFTSSMLGRQGRKLIRRK